MAENKNTKKQPESLLGQLAEEAQNASPEERLALAKALGPDVLKMVVGTPTQEDRRAKRQAVRNKLRSKRTEEEIRLVAISSGGVQHEMGFEPRVPEHVHAKMMSTIDSYIQRDKNILAAGDKLIKQRRDELELRPAESTPQYITSEARDLMRQMVPDEVKEQAQEVVESYLDGWYGGLAQTADQMVARDEDGTALGSISYEQIEKMANSGGVLSPAGGDDDSLPGVAQMPADVLVVNE